MLRDTERLKRQWQRRTEREDSIHGIMVKVGWEFFVIKNYELELCGIVHLSGTDLYRNFTPNTCPIIERDSMAGIRQSMFVRLCALMRK